MADDPLPTVTLEAVPIMPAGGPYHGSGSPPEGDYFTVEDLIRIAADTNEAIAELKPPVKLGHAPEQRLAKASGFFSTDEAPALGWLENFRVVGDEIVADALHVPRKFAQFVKARAFRTRSPEVSPFQSPSTQKAYETVVRGLAFLGARAPAMKNLNDLVALYGDDEAEAEVVTYDFAEEEGGELLVRFALVADLPPETDDAPPDGDTTKGMAETTVTEPETEATAPELLSDEQAKKLAELLGMETFDADSAAEKIEALKAPPKVEDEPEPDEQPAAPESVTVPKDEYEELRRNAAAGASAERKWHERERDDLIHGAVKEFKLDPAKVTEFAERYDKDPEGTRWFIEQLPVQNELVKTYGEDGDGMTPGDAEAMDDAHYRAYLEATGRDPEADPTLRKAS